MATTKPDYTYKWASDGDKIAPSDAKIQTGWSPEIPPYQWENWIQNRQDEMLAHINERGIAEWDNKTDYIAGKSYVQGSDGKVYKSVTASGPTTTVQDPVTDSTDTYWTIAFADVGAFLTQATGDTRYTQRSNNLSDLTNVATARTNLGLGTAATKNAQTSSTDTTAGALMAVGAFGLGDSVAMFDPSSVNLIELPTGGTYSGAGPGSPFPIAAPIWNVQGPRSFAVAARGSQAWVYTYGQTPVLMELFHTGNLPVTTFAKTLLDDADAAAARGTLDVYSKAEANGIANGIAIGVGQTWQDVTASRSIGTTYTNTTGRPILVNVSTQAQSGGFNFTVAGTVVGTNTNTASNGNGTTISAVVPSGATYVLARTTGTASTLTGWSELR